MAGTIPDAARHAGEARESIEALTRVTQGKDLPEPFAREVLIELRDLADELPNAINAVAHGTVTASEDFTEFSPAEQAFLLRAMDANEKLQVAAQLAKTLGEVLGTAALILQERGQTGPARL